MPYADLTSAAAKAAIRRRDAKYAKSTKGKARQRRYRVSDAGQVVERKIGQQKIVSGYNRTSKVKMRAKRAAYAEALFAPSPNKRIVVTGVTRLVVMQDLQLPFEDPLAVRQALEVIERVNPDTIVLNGDVVDCYRESKFMPDWRKAQFVTPEQHRRARRLMDLLKSIPKKIWLGGNHEERWWTLIKDMMARGGKLPVVDNLLSVLYHSGREIKLHDPIQSFSALFDMPEYGFTYYPYSHRLYFAEQNLIVTHGRYVSRHAGWAAKRTYEWLGRSCIVGHTHRRGFYSTTKDGREHGAWENGCLAQLEPEYADSPDWQQGLSIVNIIGPKFHVIPVPIVRETPDRDPIAVYEG